MKPRPASVASRAAAWPALLCCAAGLVTHAAEPGARQSTLIAGSDVAVVRIASGRIQGFVNEGVYTFRGIPYATAERFMPPEEVAPWDGTRLTLSYGNICPQPTATELREPQTFISDTRFWPASENCLSLNIWTPAIGPGKKRPVMVWLHGGGFSSGSSMQLPVYDGTNLAGAGDIVLVSLNHRLNVLGFLDLSAYGESFKLSGNAGMLDIVAALEWVRREIHKFGGDPSNITIFGQSGGGAKVATLLAAPSAKGLFQKAIIQSGAPGSIGPAASAPETAKRIAELTLAHAGVDENDIAGLQSISYEELHAAARKALADVSNELGLGGNPFGFPGVNWSPVVDGEFLPERPFGDAAPPTSKGVPLMVGSTLSEFANLDPRFAKRHDWDEADVLAFLRKEHGEAADAIFAAYNKAYPELAPRDWLTIDTMFRPSVLRTANMKAAQGDPVYTYVFAWRSPVLDFAWAAGHSAELAFVFANPLRGIQSHGGGPVVEALAAVMSEAWIRFARTGNPNHDGLADWPAFTRELPATMIFDADPDVRVGHDAELLQLLSTRH